MKLEALKIKGSYCIHAHAFSDARGSLIKPYHLPTLEAYGVHFVPKETYFSSSSKNVLRGLHLQRAPYASAKLVSCMAGEIFDVFVDLHPDSPTFLETETRVLSSDNDQALSSFTRETIL